MPGWVTLLLVIAVYLVVTQWLLPRLGVPT